ncbi:MAG: hypothetical protein HY305_05805 [Sphingobacteriales bacterium]|nr:hypothetical protein [Sphingobacteriales bacterium]
MAYKDTSNDQLTGREKNMVMVRSLTNYVMGVFLLIAGCFFMFPVAATAPIIDKYDPVMIKFFAVICWIYGAFRIYRGYSKNYFRN